jgi:hypothetical protein
LAWISLSQPLHQHVPYYKRTLRSSLSQSNSASQTYAAYRSLHLRDFFFNFIFEYYAEQALYSESGEITMLAKKSNWKDRRQSGSA